MSSTLHIVMVDGGGGTVGPTKHSSNAIIYPSPLWFYREPDVVDEGTYYKVDCFSKNNFRWNDKSGTLKEVKKITFVDTKGNSHDVMFLGLDDYFCYKKEGDGYIRATGSPSVVEGAVKTVGDVNISGNKASYWAKPITLILTVPNGYLDALCVRQACWDKVAYRGDPTGEQWEDWAERFSDIPLTYSDDTAKNDPHVFGPPGGDYSAGRENINGYGYYYMNGIVYNMQQYTKYNVFHIILPAQCIVEWAAKPKPPYFYTGGQYYFLPHTISELRQIIKDGEYDSTSTNIQNGIQYALISNNTPFDYDLAIGKKSSSMIKRNSNLPEYIWGATIDNWRDLWEANYKISYDTRDFSNHYARIQIPASSTSPLYYSSDINYCLLDVGSNVYNPIGDNGLSSAQWWITSISPLDGSVTFSDKKPTENENKPNIGVSFYPSEGGKIRVYDYYLPHKITNTQYRGKDSPQDTLPCTLYDKGSVKYISSSDDYTYSVTLSEPNFRLGFVDDKAANERYGVTWHKNSAPWAANNSGSLEGYFVLKDDPSLSVLPTIHDYNSYKYSVTIKNNDLFPAIYYIEDNDESKTSVSLDPGDSFTTSISIPREQTYSSPRNINHKISVYSREGGKEQAASATVQVPNVPRNTMTYHSYYGKGTITVTRTSHFGFPVNETLSSGSYIWQGDVLSISITNIPSGYSFNGWNTGSTSTSFTYTVGTSSVYFQAQLTRSSYTFYYSLGTGREARSMEYRTLNTSGSYSSWSSFTGSKTLSTDDQVSYTVSYLPHYASNSNGSATTESGTITMSSNVSKSFTAAAYMECYFGHGLGATDVVIKVDGTQVTNESWRWITNTTHRNIYYSCYFRSSNTDTTGNIAYAFNPLDMGDARSSSALGNDGWGADQHPSENGLYTVFNNKYSTGYTTRIPAGSGGNYYYCTGARYYAYFRFKLAISLSLYHDWYYWGDKKALYNVYPYCQTYDWSKMSSKDWHDRGSSSALSIANNLTLQGGNTFTFNSNKKWNSSLGFYYYESNGADGGVGDICLNGNPILYYKDNSNLSEGIHTNVSSSGSYCGYGKCNGAQTLYAYQATWTGPDTDAYKVAWSVYDASGPANHGTFYICEMHPYKSNGCKTWYTEAIND